VKFLDIIGGWVNDYFSNEEAVYLIVMIAVVLAILLTLGGTLAPVLTGLVVAFLLQGLVKWLERAKVPRLLCVYLSVLLFLGGVIAFFFLVVPVLGQQLQGMVELLPTAMVRLRDGLDLLVERFPEYVTEEQVASFVDQGTRELGNMSGLLLETAFSQVYSVFGLLIYLVLVPISVFFFLKDKDQLIAWLHSLLPADRPLLDAVGEEMNAQLGNYVRGKFIEILIVGAATFVCLTFLGVNYAALLGVLVGLSVLIPFVGAAVVTLPVLVVAIIQFGWSWELASVMGVYGVIQFLDGNVLVPLLFSEVVDLHPITIIVSVLAFGGIWGVWGVFFAIPLATLIKAIYNAWPRTQAPPDIVDDPA
jgi:putative permease